VLVFYRSEDRIQGMRNRAQDCVDQARNGLEGAVKAILWPKKKGRNVPPADVLERFAGHLCGRVERAFVFGSFGTEAFRPGSDIDLLLVVWTELPFVERARHFDDLYRIHPNLDLLVYTPEELEEQLAAPTGFWASVRSSLRELPLK